MDFKDRITFLILFAGIAFLPLDALAQEKNVYRITPFPDIWYNDVDGIRLGVRLLGEMDDSFLDGPHRLDVGIWVGTKFPKNPISYYISYLEPVPRFTQPNNEFSIQGISQIRTGFSQHKIQVKKRTQDGFDERYYAEAYVSLSQEKMFDSSYRLFPQRWRNVWKTLLDVDILFSDRNWFGDFIVNVHAKHNLNPSIDYFSVLSTNIKQNIELGPYFAININGYYGYASEMATPEYYFSYGFGQADDWLNNGFSRAKGTLPMALVEDGLISTNTDFGLRGYLGHEADLFKMGSKPNYNSIWYVNSELDFPNPVDFWLKSKKIIGNLSQFRTYLLFDIGKAYTDSNLKYASPNLSTLDKVSVLANAGIGAQFSINIPDYLGKNRGIFIRYDAPLWVSKPKANENNFSYRQIIGIGAIFSF